MRDDLRFVQGAVAKKDFVPELTHYTIHAGRITGFNGRMALSSPIEIDLSCRPKATTFVKAIETGISESDDPVAMHMTGAGRLALKSGKFKAYIDCLPEDAPVAMVAPSGIAIEVGEGFISCLKTLSPFMGVDASRPWSSGIMLKGQSGYATNNICVAEYWHGEYLTTPVNIPSEAVRELIRIAESPIRVQCDEHSITFHFKGKRWMRTQLLSTDWPEAMYTLLETEATFQPMPAFIPALEKLKPFIDKAGHVHLRNGGLSTSNHDGLGVEYEVPKLSFEGMTFHHEQLKLVAENATHIDLSTFPKPCKFQGDYIRGMIIGIRQ